MEIIIHQAILHVLDTTMDAPVLSGGGMEMTAEKTAYFQYHIEKLLASDDIRQCRPLPDSAFKNELEHNHDFVDLSCRIAGVLFDYMHAHTTIPGADLAVVDFTRDGEPWLGILKLNYKNGYTHYTENVEGAPVNSIIQQRACLPSQSGKVEEGALVNLTDYSMKLLEKKFARPSEIFTSLAEYYEKNGLTGISHSRLARYEILYRFLEEKEVKVEQSTSAAEDPAGMEQKTGVKAAETAVKLTLADFRDSLMYDLYVRENIKSRPSFASDQSPYKKEVREFFMAEEESPQWLTDYAGFDSKQMAKMAHLEHMEDGTFVLFDYKNRDPLSGNARAVRFRYDRKGSRMVPAKRARI